METRSHLPKAWITGAGGFIASHLIAEARRQGRWSVIPVDRRRFDLRDAPAVKTALQCDGPDLVIHCAALSDTSRCEQEPDLARQVNVEATQRLADLAGSIPLVHLSTDMVFDGQHPPYTEDAPTSPLTVYGRTKAASESLVLANPAHTVVRTSLNAGLSPSGNRSFNEQLRNALAAGRQVTLFDDEFRNPIPASATARAIWELVEARATGLYHLAGSGRASRYAIGEALARRWAGLASQPRAGSLRDYSGPPRSPDTTLDCSRVQARLSFPLPDFMEWLDRNPDEPL